MPKTTHVSFSDNTVKVTLPKSWAELTNDELLAVYSVMECYEEEDVRFPLLCYFSGLVYDKGYKTKGEEKRFTLSFCEGEGKERTFAFYLSPMELAVWVEELNWIAEPGDVPVRLDYLSGAKAVDAKLHGVDFQTYYMMENLYQGYIQSRNPRAIHMIEQLLYPGTAADDSPTTGRILNILNWTAQLKTLFSKQFPHFLRPSAGSEGAPNMLEIMNTQIRALTGGDVTKEEAINKTDCWRALTELDFKAKEADEFRRQQAKYKK